jgi:hypothetical protein
MIRPPIRRAKPHRQPTRLIPVDRSNPLAVELQSAAIASDSAQFIDLALGRRFSDLQNGGSFNLTAVRREGRARYHGGAGGYSNNITLASNAQRGKTTLVTILRMRGSTGANTRVISNAGESSGNWDMARIQAGPNDTFQGLCVNGTVLNADGPYITDQVYVLGVTNDASAPTNKQKFFVNGVRQSATSNYSGNSSKQLNTHGLSAGNAVAGLVEIYASFAWSRALSDDEMMAFARDPYQVVPEPFMFAAIPYSAMGNVFQLSWSDNLPVVDDNSGLTASQLAAVEAVAALSLSDPIASSGGVVGEVTVVDSVAGAIRQTVTGLLDSLGAVDQGYAAGSITSVNGQDAINVTDTRSTNLARAASRADGLAAIDNLTTLLTGQDSVTIDANGIPKSRWVIFGGGARVVVFPGTSRVVVFNGTSRVVEHRGTSRVVEHKVSQE